MKLDEALGIADHLIERIGIFCDRIEIAGSVRRQRPEVNDIEIVAQLRPACLDLLGYPVPGLLDLRNFGKPIKDGPKYKQIALPEGINLDFFIVSPPAHWGVIFAIRTGPAAFSHALVTKRQYGGYLPSWAKPSGGAIYDKTGEVIPMPEEEDFLKFCGFIKKLEPWDRDNEAELWKFR